MNTVIFDLDGTLLPIDSELFMNQYFKLLAQQAKDMILEPEALIKAVWTGTKAMLNNDGSMTNEDRFWSVFTEILGEKDRRLEPIFESFYRKEYLNLETTTQVNPLIKECIDLLIKKGYQLVVATNPVFPRIAIEARIRWAGLEPEMFQWITSYENSSYSKPNLNYYRDVLKKIGRQSSDCLMVGNDIAEDMCVVNLGMEAFLLKDQMILSDDILAKDPQYKAGYVQDLWNFIRELPVAD